MDPLKVHAKGWQRKQQFKEEEHKNRINNTCDKALEEARRELQFLNEIEKERERLEEERQIREEREKEQELIRRYEQLRQHLRETTGLPRRRTAQLYQERPLMPFNTTIEDLPDDDF